MKPISKFHYFVLIYYRLIGITFGGARVNKNWVIEHCLFWKVYGYVSIIIILITIPIKSYLKDDLPEMIELFHYKDQFKFMISLTYVVETIKFIQIAANLITLNCYGEIQMKITSKYRLTHTKNRVIMQSLWICHVIIPLLIIIFYFALIDLSIQGMIIKFSEMFIEFQMALTISILSWWVSLCIWEDLNKIKNQIISCQVVTPHFLIYNRKLFIDARKSIQQLDRTVGITFIIDAVGTVVGLMIQIYVSTFGYEKIPVIGKFYRSYIFGTVASTIELMANCVINGYVHEEVDEVIASLDDVYIKGNNDLAYKELMIFMSISKDVKFGFTIAGFMPWKKTTLLSLFTFILTYTVILLQTGAM